MNFAQAIASGFKNFANFKGVARRSEYWYFALFTFLLGLVLSTVESVIWNTPEAPFDPSNPMESFQLALAQPTYLSSLASLILFLPQLSMLVRRVRDAGYSAKWLFLYLIPVVMTFAALAVAYYVMAGLQPSESMIEYIAILGVVAVFGLSMLAVSIFFLVVTIKPSKSAEEGNKYL